MNTIDNIIIRLNQKGIYVKKVILRVNLLKQLKQHQEKTNNRTIFLERNTMEH